MYERRMGCLAPVFAPRHKQTQIAILFIVLAVQLDFKALGIMRSPISWENLSNRGETEPKQNIKQTASLEVSFSNKHTQTHLKTGGCLQFGFGRLLAVSF